MWKRTIADYLSFTKKDRLGIFVLLLLIVICLLLPYFFPYFIPQKRYDYGEFEKAIASLNIQPLDSPGYNAGKNPGGYDELGSYGSPRQLDNFSPAKGELFYFDPNTASKEDWKRLGIREKTINTIQRYISKGGRFYKKEDIRKIWGMHKNEADRLMPFVQIAERRNTTAFSDNSYERKVYKKEQPALSEVDINLADTATFIALPGIGSKLSKRIILFRDKLGGFYEVAQIGETYGLPDSTFQKIKHLLKITPGQIRRININTATAEELKAHPYLRYQLANLIVNYRNQHGNYQSIDELKKIMTVNDSVFNKLAPYLAVH